MADRANGERNYCDGECGVGGGWGRRPARVKARRIPEMGGRPAMNPRPYDTCMVRNAVSTAGTWTGRTPSTRRAKHRAAGQVDERAEQHGQPAEPGGGGEHGEGTEHEQRGCEGAEAGEVAVLAEDARLAAPVGVVLAEQSADGAAAEVGAADGRVEPDEPVAPGDAEVEFVVFGAHEVFVEAFELRRARSAGSRRTRRCRRARPTRRRCGSGPVRRRRATTWQRRRSVRTGCCLRSRSLPRRRRLRSGGGRRPPWRRSRRGGACGRRAAR